MADEEKMEEYKSLLRIMFKLRSHGVLDFSLAPTKRGGEDVVLLCLMIPNADGIKQQPVPFAVMKPKAWILECTPLTHREQYVTAETVCECADCVAERAEKERADG